MPQQPGHSRFRPEDLTTRPVSSSRDLDLDAMTMYVDYLLMRIGEQREEVERKLVALRGPRTRPTGPCASRDQGQL